MDRALDDDFPHQESRMHRMRSDAASNTPDTFLDPGALNSLLRGHNMAESAHLVQPPFRDEQVKSTLATLTWKGIRAVRPFLTLNMADARGVVADHDGRQCASESAPAELPPRATPGH